SRFGVDWPWNSSHSSIAMLRLPFCRIVIWLTHHRRSRSWERAVFLVRAPSALALLFRENESLRLVVAVRAHAARLVDLLAQALTGLAKQSFDLRTERLDVGSGRSLAGGAGIARLRVGRNDALQLGGAGREDALQLGRLDVPLA